VLNANPKVAALPRRAPPAIHARHDRPVLPIVVYVRRGEPGIRLETLTDDVCGIQLSVFRYFSLGLARCPAADYLGRPEPLAWALAALMHSGRMRRAEHKLACLRRIASGRLNDARRLLLVNCVESYLELNPEEAAELEALSRLSENQEARIMAMTWAERMIAQGRREGKEDGIEEGRRQVTQIVLDLLSERFGAVSDRVREQLETESLDRLRLLAKRVLRAKSLDDSGLGFH